MWADDSDGDGKGIFGNDLLDPLCNPQIDNCVFVNKPHATTAKAMMINSSNLYVFEGLDPPNPDLSRDKQGWGLPSAGKLYELRNQFRIVSDEDDNRLLTDGTSQLFFAAVPANAAALMATMVYADPANVPLSNPNRVNDLTLKLISPSGVIYWGNNGLMTSNWSTPAGSPDTINTVENVFIAEPEEGQWQVHVLGYEIIEDGHTETPALDADFALVVSYDLDCNGNFQVDSQDISVQDSLDCNDNAVPDECDIANCAGGDPACQDCNLTTVPDECDIAEGISLDCDGNGVPDECQFVMVDPPDAAPAEAGFPKNRYLSFVPTNPGVPTALRVKITKLLDVPISEFWWVDPTTVRQVCENSGHGLETLAPDDCGAAPGLVPRWFWVATLTNLRVSFNWSTTDVMHVYSSGIFHNAIVPSYKTGLIPFKETTYEVQAISVGGDASNESDFSVSLNFSMPRWGDIVGDCQSIPCSAPNESVDIVSDVVAVLNKFSNDLAILKVRTDLVPNSSPGINLKVDIAEALEVLNAFQDFDYPWANDPPLGSVTPGTSTCP